jgi:hypothetical protein
VDDKGREASAVAAEHGAQQLGLLCAVPVNFHLPGRRIKPDSLPCSQTPLEHSTECSASSCTPSPHPLVRGLDIRSRDDAHRLPRAQTMQRRTTRAESRAAPTVQSEGTYPSPVGKLWATLAMATHLTRPRYPALGFRSAPATCAPRARRFSERGTFRMAVSARATYGGAPPGLVCLIHPGRLAMLLWPRRLCASPQYP